MRLGEPTMPTAESLKSGEKTKSSVNEEQEGGIRIEDKIKATKAKFPRLVRSFSGNVEDIDGILEESRKLDDELKNLEKQKREEDIRNREEAIRAEKEKGMEILVAKLSIERSILMEKNLSRNNARPDNSGRDESIERIERRIENLEEETNILNGKSVPRVKHWREKTWSRIQESAEDAETETGKKKFQEDRNEAWCALKDLEDSNLEELGEAVKDAENNIKIGEENFTKMKNDWQSLPMDQRDEALNRVRELNRWKRRFENLKLAIDRKKVLGR